MLRRAKISLAFAIYVVVLYFLRSYIADFAVYLVRTSLFQHWGPFLLLPIVVMGLGVFCYFLISVVVDGGWIVFSIIKAEFFSEEGEIGHN